MSSTMQCPRPVHTPHFPHGRVCNAQRRASSASPSRAPPASLSPPAPSASPSAASSSCGCRLVDAARFGAALERHGDEEELSVLRPLEGGFAARQRVGVRVGSREAEQCGEHCALRRAASHCAAALRCVAASLRRASAKLLASTAGGRRARPSGSSGASALSPSWPDGQPCACSCGS